MKSIKIIGLFSLISLLIGCSISLLEEVSEAIPVSPPIYLAEGYNAALFARYGSINIDAGRGLTTIPATLDVAAITSLFGIPGFMDIAADVSKSLLAPAINLEITNKVISYKIRQYRSFFRFRLGKQTQYGQVGDIIIPLEVKE